MDEQNTASPADSSDLNSTAQGVYAAVTAQAADATNAATGADATGSCIATQAADAIATTQAAATQGVYAAADVAAAAQAAMEPPTNPHPSQAWSTAERVLLPAALLIGILFDRLMVSPMFNARIYSITTYMGVFWLSYLAILYAFFWKMLRGDKVMWYVAACASALCIWNLIYRTGNIEFRVLSYIVIPSVLMAHAQYSAGRYVLKDTLKIVAAWLSGWFIKPLTGLTSLFSAAGSLISSERKPLTKRVAVGAVFTLLLMCVIVPLLGSADKVFGYYLRKIASGLDIPTLTLHIIISVIFFALFYSFLWNIGFGKNNKSDISMTASIDAVICDIVLTAISLLYILFCGVQFTYLFARAGLPGGMTYSSYAREGFAQTVAICALNLMIYGVFIRFGDLKKLVKPLLACLLGLTGIMLFSGFVRLKLYIDAYGMTWLRLLSAWFIIYLAAVILLSAYRMVNEKLPAVAVCALLLLGWYVALGFANPDSFIAQFNKLYFPY